MFEFFYIHRQYHLCIVYCHRIKGRTDFSESTKIAKYDMFRTMELEWNIGTFRNLKLLYDMKITCNNAILYIEVPTLVVISSDMVHIVLIN